jgi:pimeloyl-ACP methyl ester carboxylesterase
MRMTEIARIDKPTLVLVPGLICDAVVFRHQTEAFKDAYDVRVPLLGAYDSISAMAARVLDDVRGGFALVGHSLGGRIALEIVHQARERVTRLALLDTGVHPCTPGEPEQRQKLLSIAFSEGMHAVAREWLPPMLHPARRADPDFLKPLTAMIERYSPETFRNQVTALLNRPDATPVLDEIDCPTIVMCGREDTWSPPAQHEVIAAAVRRSRFIVVESCGHMAPFEQPEVVTKELARWLDASDASRT